METLFPRHIEPSPKQPTAVEKNMTSISNEGKKAILRSPEMASETASNTCSENGNLQINWDLIGQISSQAPENAKRLLVRKKVELEQHIKLTTSAVSRLIEQRSHSSEAKDFPFAASRLIADLTSLMSVLHTSEYDTRAVPVICVLLKRMEKRRP